MFVYGGKESNEDTRKDGKRRGLDGKKVTPKQRRRETKCGREKRENRRRKKINVLKEGRAAVNK
jgi:hypothetical protein